MEDHPHHSAAFRLVQSMGPMIIDWETPGDRLKYIQDVLKAVKRRGLRYRNANKRRSLLKDYLTRGELPSTGPAFLRMEFIRQGAQKVIELLGSLGLAFNAANADDVATPHDLLDVLATATKRAAREGRLGRVLVPEVQGLGAIRSRGRNHGTSDRIDSANGLRSHSSRDGCTGALLVNREV